MKTMSRTAQMPRVMFEHVDMIMSDKRPAPVPLSPMSDLNLMIANGWGDTPQERLPHDWRTRILPPNGNARLRGRRGPRKSNTTNDNIDASPVPLQT